MPSSSVCNERMHERKCSNSSGDHWSYWFRFMEDIDAASRKICLKGFRWCTSKLRFAPHIWQQNSSRSKIGLFHVIYNNSLHASRIALKLLLCLVEKRLRRLGTPFLAALTCSLKRFAHSSPFNVAYVFPLFHGSHPCLVADPARPYACTRVSVSLVSP